MTKDKGFKADMMLLLVCMAWGLSYYAMDVCLETMSVYSLNFFRFFGAFIIIFAFTFKKFKGITKPTIFYSIALGVILSVVYVSATMGVLYTTISNTAFLIASSVVLIVIFEFILFRKRPKKMELFAVLLCFVGIAFLTLKEDFSINMANLKGDLLALLCAVVYTMQIIVTDRGVKREDVDAYQLGVLSMGVCGVIMFLLSVATGGIGTPVDLRGWGFLIFLACLCTGVAYVAQPIAQQYTSPSHVGIIFALEPVFASITAYFLAGEVLPARGYLGEVLMIASLVLVEVDLRHIFSRKEGADSLR